MSADQQGIQYVGFWARLLAQIVDTTLGLLLIVPLLYGLYGNGFLDFDRLRIDPMAYLIAFEQKTGVWDPILSYLLPPVLIVIFWLTQEATPGKMLIGARVVDVVTLNKLGTFQAILRYLGYYVSLIPFFIGMFWIGFDARKQGWHDKIAGKLVIRNKKQG